MNNDFFNDQSSKDQFNSIYQLIFRQSKSQQYNQIGGLVDQDIFAYFLFVINILVVLFTWINVLWKPKKYGRIHYIYSFILSIYEYLLYLPSLLLSLEHSQPFMVYINCPLTFIIGLLTSSLDYSLEYNSKDFLSKMDNNWNNIQFSVDIILMISYVYGDRYIHSSIVICINSLKIFQSLKNYTYLNSWIYRYYFIIQIFKLSTGIFIFFMAVNLIDFDALFLGCLVAIPISIKIGCYIFQQLQDFLILQLIQDPSQQQIIQPGLFSLLMRNQKKNLDLACRILYTYSMKNDEWNSIKETKDLLFIYQIGISSEQQQQFKQTKISKQQQVKQEAASKIETDQLDNRQLSDIEQIKLVNNFIMRVYKQMFEKSNEVFDQNFSFLYFILVSQENDCIPYRAVLNLKKDFQNKFTLKQIQKLETAIRAVDKKIEFKSLLVKKKVNLQLFSILDFDNSINKIVQDYTTCLRLYKDAVTLLAQSFIDLNIALNYLDTYRKERNNLQQTIKNTIQKNTHSEQLRNICLNFDYYLNQNAFLSMYFEKMQRENQQTAQLMKEYYNPYTCFCYVSLLKKSQGQIIRVSRTFTKAFYLSSKQMALQQNITVFLNQCLNLQSQSGGISAYHFIEHNFNNYNEIINISLLIGKDSFGFAIPLQVQIQSQKLEDIDFGFTLWIKPLIDQKVYILLDQKIKSKVTCISRTMKDYLLPEEFNVNNTHRLRIDTMIPILKGYLNMKKDFKIRLDTLYVRPTTKGSSISNDLDTESPNYLISLLSKELFFVTITFQKQSNKLIKFSFVEIENFYALSTIEEKISSVFALQTQLKELCNIQLDFDPTSHYSFYDVKQTIEVKKIVEEGLLKIDSNDDKDFSFVDSKMFQSSKRQTQQQEKQQISQFSFETKHKIGEMKQVKDLDKTNKLNSTILKSEEEEMQKELRKHYTIVHREEKVLDKETTQEGDFNQSMYVPGLDSLNQSNTNLMTDKNNLRTFFTNLKKTNIRQNDRDMQVIGTNDESKFNTQGELRRTRKNDQKQSITSSTKSVTDTHIINLIHAKKEMIQLKVINILGLLSILITLILTLTGFQIFISRMLIQQDNFQYINWLYSINIQISQAYSEQNIKFLEQNGLWKIPTASDDLSFNQLIDKLLKQRHSISSKFLMQQSQCTNPNIQVFDIIKNYQIIQRIYFNKNVYTNITVSLLYSLDMQMANLFHFVYDQDAIGLFRFTGQNNYPAINSLLGTINDELDSSYISQLSEIQNQTQIQLFVVMSVSFFFLMSIIPSYQFLKTKQQNIMELFATFDPKYLKDILYRIYSQIGSQGFSDKSSVMAIKLSQSNFNSEPSRNFEYQIQITKKMNISRTSRLSYSVKLLSFALFLLFGFIMVYPITNYFVVFQFIKNSKLIYNFNSNFQKFILFLLYNVQYIFLFNKDITVKLYFNLINSLRARQAISIGYLLPQYSGLPISFFQQFYESVLPSFNSQLEQFQEQLSSLKEEKIYDEDYIKGFLVPLLEINACQTLLDNPEYQGQNFDINQCLNVNKQIMQRGFILGLKSYYLRFKENYDFIYQYDPAAYQTAFDIFNLPANGYQQLLLKDQVTKIFDILLQFLYDQNNLLYNYYKSLSIIMLCQQLVLIIILYVFGWRLYYRRINETIFQTKDLLDIFPTSTLIQNSYIMSFLKKNE